ncbi:MAG: trigger factor [Chloroflexi bacterium]|nr:trigger factor [Chloroflexota bacterium]
MKVTQDEVVDRQTNLHIEVDSDLLEQHMDRAYRKLVQQTSVPGFRKGKAPRHILERVVGRDSLLDEAIETLTPEAVADAIEEQSLDPVTLPRVTVEEREPVLTLTATVALPPTVELGEYHSLRFDEQAEPVTDEQVEGAVERVREGQASWEPAERPLVLGDLAVLTVTGTVGALTIIESADTEYLAAEGIPYPVPGFAEGLVGMSPGDSREFVLTLPEDFGVADAAGQEATFRVSVSEIKQKILPPLDDELARSLGEGLESLSDLRSRIRENLEASAEQVVRRLIEDKTLEAVVDGAAIALPAMLVDHEAQHVLDEQQRALAVNNVPMSAYMERVGKSEDEVIAEAREAAERRLKRSLVLDELADAEGIEVPDADVEEELETLRQRRSNAEDGPALDEEGARVSISRILRRQRLMDHMVRLVRGLDDDDAQSAQSAQSEQDGPGEEETEDETPGDASEGAPDEAAGGSSAGGR